MAATAALFAHLPRFRLLLCKACRYCVLPGSLPRHLKAIHHMRSAERELYSKQTEHFDLSPSSDIAYPEPNEPPIAGLAVLNGLACCADSCMHLCRTLKRMHAHWRAEHYKHVYVVHYRPVKLQTFFRGHNLRYFIVNTTSTWAERFSADLARTAPAPGTTVYYSEVACEDELDWFLLQYFHCRTYKAISPLKGRDGFWRDLILQTAVNFGFVRCIVLGLAAAHLQSALAEDHIIYTGRSNTYMELAIRKFSSQVDRVNTTNIPGVFHFCRMMPYFLLANTQQSPRRKTAYLAAKDDDIVPPWMWLQCRARSILQPNLELIRNWDGRLYRLLTGAIYNKTIDYAANPEDPRLRALFTLVQFTSGPGGSQSCADALQSLRSLWVQPLMDPDVSFRDVSVHWGSTVSENYLRQVQAGLPAALIVLAHFCVLLSLAEDDYWYTKGHAETILSNIRRNLQSSWHSWISWPVSVVGTTS